MKKTLLAALLLAPWPAMARPPVVRIIAPQPGAQVTSGEKVQIQVLLQSAPAGASLQIMADGKGIGLLDKAPYSVWWDTSGLEPGAHQVQVNLFQADGSQISSNPVQVVVKGSGAGGSALNEGQPIILLTEEFMKSGETQTGSTIRFRVDRDVLLPDGRILVAAGAQATGEVIKSEPHGLFGQAGELNFAIRSVQAVDGTSVPLRAVKNAEGDSIMAPVIVGAVLISPLLLLFNGPNVEIPANTAFSAFVDKTTTISKPNPSRLDANALKTPRTVTIMTPSEGSKAEKSDKFVISLNIEPADDNAYVRLYLDDQVIKIFKGSGKRIEWNADNAKEGSHRLEAEVTYPSGQIVRSPAIHFTLE